VLGAATKGLQAADLFQDELIDGLPRIGEAVNSRARSFADVIRLVESSQKFKAWLKKQAPDEALRKTYLEEVAHLDWADKLPPKALRWLLFTGAGIGLGAVGGPVAGMLAGVALSAGDTFLLDKFLRGWKPNQFVEGPLKDFLKT
jgi:hypothetical protein